MYALFTVCIYDYLFRFIALLMVSAQVYVWWNLTALTIDLHCQDTWTDILINAFEGGAIVVGYCVVVGELHFFMADGPVGEPVFSSGGITVHFNNEIVETTR